MNLNAWTAGLVLGSALSLALEWGGRALLVWLRKRRTAECVHCTGILGDDGRAEFPVERLNVCGVCGDTWPDVIVDRTEHARGHGRGTVVPALRARPVPGEAYTAPAPVLQDEEDS